MMLYLATHLSEYFRLRGILFHDRQLCAERHRKWTSLKHVRAYAARFLDRDAKRDFMTVHYDFVSDRLLSARSKEVLSGRAYLWKNILNGNVLGIELRRSTLTAIEGELVLNYKYNGRIIFMLTFSIVPGSYFDESTRQVIFVGGLQGRPACREDIRAASKLNREIDPATMLLVALKSIGIAWNIDMIVAISARHQISADAIENAEERFAIYDRFRIKSGATPHLGKVFKLSTRFQRGAQDPALGTHRSRTRRKRLAKDGLREDLAECVSRIFTNSEFPAAA